MPDIYPVKVDSDEMQILFDVLNKYSDIIRGMIGSIGGTAAEDYNKAAGIINTLLAKTEDAISPMPCLSKACVNGNYCYRAFGQCDFVVYIKKGYHVARVSDDQVAIYESIGWSLAKRDNGLKPSAKRCLMIYKKDIK